MWQEYYFCLAVKLVPHPGKIESGEMLFYKPVKRTGSGAMVDVVNIAALDPKGEEIADIRGNHISMVFQEPMTAMIPVRTIGEQITDRSFCIRRFQQAARAASPRYAVPRQNVPSGEGDRRLSVPVERRHASRRDRHGAQLRPSLLIADEPTTALDVTTEAQILDLMRSLQNDFGMAIMYITHNLGVVAEMPPGCGRDAYGKGCRGDRCDDLLNPCTLTRLDFWHQFRNWMRRSPIPTGAGVCRPSRDGPGSICAIKRLPVCAVVRR